MRCEEGEATDDGHRRRARRGRAGVCHAQSGENLWSYAAATATTASCSISSSSSPLPSSLFPLPSSLSEGMRRQFVPGHFFRFADNKPSRFASLLPSLLSIERRPPPPTQTRREWRYDNTGDVKIAPWFIASFLFIRQLWCCTTYQGFLSTRDTGLRDGNPPPSAEPRQCEWTVGFLDRRGDLHEKSATLPPPVPPSSSSRMRLI